MKLDPVLRLILELARLPGIGERSAARLAYYLIKDSRASHESDSPSLAADLAAALMCMDSEVRLCRDCQNVSVDELCSVCTDTRRDNSLLCVVEGIADLRSIEKSNVFAGRFHVLHGALSPLDGIGPEELKLGLLLERVKRSSVSEVIIATNANVDGDATALYVARLLKPTGVRVTRLASGMPMGGELEYLDGATVSRALQHRREL